MTRLIEPGMTYLDANGSPLASGNLHFYVAGAVGTNKTTYSDSALTTANANPVPLDSAGKASVDVFGSGDYALVVKDSGGTTIHTFDPLDRIVTDATEVTYTAPFTGAVERTINAVLAERPSVADWNADLTGATDATTAIQTAIDYISANGGGELGFPFNSTPKAVGLVLKDGVYLVSGLGPNASPSGARPAVITAAATGTIIDTSGTQVFNCGVRGMGFVGLGASTAAKGINFNNVSRGQIINCSFNNFSDQAILLDADTIACVIQDNHAQNCLLDRTQAAKIGVLDVDGSDHWIVRGEYTASVTALSDANAYLCGVVIRGAEHFVDSVIGEISDVGICVTAVTSPSRFINCRADLNYGNGWEIGGSTSLSSCLALNNGQETTNTYDGFYISQGNGTLANCTADSTAANKHRYGFNDVQSSDTVKFFYDALCRSFQHATGAFNLTADGGAHQTPTGPSKNFTDADTTPSVSNYGSFVADNTGATSITDFDDGFEGQEITIRTTNANTTFVHNASVLVTNTGANKASVTSGLYKFRLEEGVWRESTGY